MSEYCVVVAVSNPASVDPLTRMGCTLAEANDGSVKITSVKKAPAQLPTSAYDEIGSKEEAIVERALSVAVSFDAPAEGLAPSSRDPAESIISLIDHVDASALLVGESELIPFQESWFRQTLVETVIDQVTCDIYVERIGPGPALPGDSMLVPVAEGAHANTTVRIASDLGKVHNMDVHLVTVLPQTSDVKTIRQTENRLQSYPPDEADVKVQTEVVLGDRIVETLVDLTADHDMTVLGATEKSKFEQFLSGTIPTGLAKRGQNPLLMVSSYS
jgi:nucleotide-binding universal stress UspA family protein